MPGGGGRYARAIGFTMVGIALAVGAAACDSSDSGNNPPPPPAAFGTVHDWGNGNTVSVSAPRDLNLPGLVKTGTQSVTVFDVTVHNGGGQPVALNTYGVGVAVNGAPVSSVALGNFNTAQVPANGTAQFTEVVEAPTPNQKIDVTVSGANDDARPAVTFEGQSPTP